jgi:hypothetical protein
MGLCESLDRSEAESLAAGEVMSSRNGKPAWISLCTLKSRQLAVCTPSYLHHRVHAALCSIVNAALGLHLTPRHVVNLQAEGWEVAENERQQLLLRRAWRTENFLKVMSTTPTFFPA